MQRSVKSKIQIFFSETFRPHTKQEYAEVFSRGITDRDGEKRNYPWLYIRVFALLLVLFAVTVLAYRLTGYSVGFITAIIFGGLLFNIPVLVLFYELSPKKDISILSLLFLVLIGGAVTGSVILLGYEYIYEGHDNPWVSYLWTGFWEELVKAAFAISAIALMKKKNPVCCFLIGFAVGTGYSFFEDMGYIYMYARGGGYGITGCGWLVLMSVARGLSCICSHAPWTGVICWAFVQFKKPFLNFRFYGVVLSSMVLHYLADVPFYAEEVAFLTGFNWGWAIEAFVVIAIALQMFFMLRHSFKGFNSSICAGECVFTRANRLSQAGNITAVLCAALLAVTALVGCSVRLGATYKTIEFNTKDTIFAEEKFVRYMQNGYNFSVDWQRAYDPEQVNYSEFTENGELKCVTQEHTKNGVTYYYVYSVTEGEYFLESIGTKVTGAVYYCRRLLIFDGYSYTLYGNPPYYAPVENDWIIIDDDIEDEEPDIEPDDNPEEPIEIPLPLRVVSYFSINEDVRTFSYDSETGSFIITTYEEEFTGLGTVIVLSVISGVTLIGGATTFIILKLKSRRNEDEQLHIL